MRALLLAAGLGTRLSPITNVLPKCLVPINGRPLLEYWLHYLSAVNISPFLVNMHHLSKIVQQFLDYGPFFKKNSTVYEPTLLGTGGTALNNREFFGNDPLMLIHTDNLSFCDFQAFVKSHQLINATAILYLLPLQQKESLIDFNQ